jgi:hypothetical protein
VRRREYLPFKQHRRHAKQSPWKSEESHFSVRSRTRGLRPSSATFDQRIFRGVQQDTRLRPVCSDEGRRRMTTPPSRRNLSSWRSSFLLLYQDTNEPGILEEDDTFWFHVAPICASDLDLMISSTGRRSWPIKSI